MKNSGHNSEKGFGVFYTLILVAMVVATTMAVKYMRPPAIVEKDLVELTKKRIEVVQNAFKAYNAANNKLPCPASNTVSPAAAGFGASVAKCTATGANCTAGITCTDAVSTNSVAIGSVPVRTLNLSDDYMFDGWGRRFVYAVDADYITSTASGSNNVLVYQNGTDVTSSAGQKYALISAGRDGKGAYTRSGQKPVKCRKISSSENDSTLSGDYSSTSSGARLAIDEDNCNSVLTSGSKRFYYNGWDTNPASPTNYYDDIAAVHSSLSGGASGASGGGGGSGDCSAVVPGCPAGVAGCSWWFNASDINADGSAVTGEPSNGSKICAPAGYMWCGRAAIAKQLWSYASDCSGQTPVYRSSVAVLGNKPAVEYNGTTYATTSKFNLAPNRDFTLFAVVVKKGDGVNNGPACDTQAFGPMAFITSETSADIRYTGVSIIMDNKDNGNKFTMYNNAGPSRNETSITQHCDQLPTKAYLYYLTHDYIDNGHQETYVKRWGDDRAENVYPQPSSAAATENLLLGVPNSTNNPFSQGFEGYIAEIIAYDGTVLTAGQITTVNNYLVAKYGLTP